MRPSETHTVEPVLPVPAWSSAALGLARRELTLAEVDDSELARLVNLRRRLEHQHGWWLLAAMAAAVLAVVVGGAVVDSRFAFGALATAVASGTVWLGVLATWAQGAVFRRQAREVRLSPEATARLFRAARDADHWIEVLKSCGQRPSHAELASFVRHVDEATGG
jgi:hypothetical protein